MTAIRKITVHVPEELLKKAQRKTGEGVTETIRQGLTLVSARSAYNRLRRLRGTVHLALDVGDLRKDRK
jgi:Arc/MetJ-type ribon-helix-helix transcriptional regulator